MKPTGMVREIDNLGRIVLPKELRKIFNLEYRDPIEIFVEANYIYLKKYEINCIFCGSGDNLSVFKGKTICEKCREEMPV
jgi:transcriptional pleiotropic regulator of transition state genes